MRIRISQVENQLGRTNNSFTVEVEELITPFCGNIVLLNGIEFEGRIGDSQLDWVVCQDRSILKQLFNGGIDRWFAKMRHNRSLPNHLIIETNKDGLVSKAHMEIYGRPITVLYTTNHPAMSIELLVEKLIHME